jgi:hypothetical protein
MSADNLYRTFPSKEAVFGGLCPRDQQKRIASFVHLADSDSVFVTIAALLRAHIEPRSRQKPTLIVDGWTEAQRNPVIAATTRAVITDIFSQIELIEMKKRSEVAASIDAATAARFIFTHVGGVLKRLALEPAFDSADEAGLALLPFKAFCNGAFAPVGTEQLQ